MSAGQVDYAQPTMTETNSGTDENTPVVRTPMHHRLIHCVNSLFRNRVAVRKFKAPADAAHELLNPLSDPTPRSEFQVKLAVVRNHSRQREILKNAISSGRSQGHAELRAIS